MGSDTIWAPIFFVLIFSVANAEPEDVRFALVTFMERLGPQRTPDWGWNATSDPCTGQWKGVICDSSQQFVVKVVLDELNLTGFLDAFSLCKANSLIVLSLRNNNLTGTFPESILICLQLSYLYLNNNQFSGPLPLSLVYMENLKRFDVSDNEFSGDIPQMSRVPGLLSFLAQNNQLAGSIPLFNFSNLQEFNVSNNKLTGLIPDNGGGFNASSFLGNPGLCGEPLSIACPPTTHPPV